MIPQYCIRIRNIKVFLSTHCCYTTWERPLPLGCGSTAWWKHRCIRSFLSNTFSPLWNLAAYHSGWISISFILSSVSSLRWSRPPGKVHLYVYYAFLTHTDSFFLACSYVMLFTLDVCWYENQGSLRQSRAYRQVCGRLTAKATGKSAVYIRTSTFA